MVNKSNDNITIDDQDWHWCPNHNIEGNCYGMYTNHPANKNMNELKKIIVI